MADLEGRVQNLEIWHRKADIDLYGVPGTEEIGLVRDYRETKAEHRGQQKTIRVFITLVGISNAILALIIALEKLGLVK